MDIYATLEHDMEKKEHPHKLAFGVRDALAMVPVSRSFLYEEMSEGRLKTFKMGRRRLIAADALNTWLENYNRARGGNHEE